MNLKRAIIVVLDGVGIGEQPDADRFSDRGSDTLGHIDQAVEDFRLPNFETYGLGLIRPFRRMAAKASDGTQAYGKCRERSQAKDTIIGHWEITGLVSEKALPLFPDGFPREFIARFERAAGKKTIGNTAASGTKIIERLGPRHMETGEIIVYTSADSVFQIAAHKDVLPVPELYRICQAARDLLTGELAVGRVIARPFEGTPGRFVRTKERHDFSLAPTGKTLLDVLAENRLKTFGIGKIRDIYAGRGVPEFVRTDNNLDGLTKTLAAVKEKKSSSLIYTNLVDTDMVYGHRRDTAGFCRALREIDGFMPDIIGALSDGDLLFITADHGCDAAFKGTDHTREYVPLFVLGNRVRSNVDLGIRETFGDIAATISEHVGVSSKGLSGRSFLKEISA